jgi:sarcosine oxidase subunit alpha
MERSAMVSADRWQLVGLETLDGSVLPDGALAPVPGKNANDQQKTQGRVTSTYFSPTLGRGIAMGLVHKGTERMGKTIEFRGEDGKMIAAAICDPVFFDKAGEKQNV